MKKLITLGLVIGTSLFATNGLNQIGIGVKSKGMGGVGIAYPQDVFAAAHNPAGLVLLCDRFDLGLHWLNHRSTHLEEHGIPTLVAEMKRSQRDLWWPEGGINWRFCSNQALAVAVYVKGEFEVRAFGADKIPRGMDYGELFITPAYSWQLHPCHQIGIAVNIAVGRMRITNNPVQPNQSVTEPYGDTFLTNAGYDYEWGVSARFGWIGRFRDCLQLGITYQTPTYMSPFRKYRGFVPAGGQAVLPAELGIGIAWWPLLNFVASIDVVKIFWRDGSLFRNPTNSESTLFGANWGPGFGWNEQTVFKFGIAWDIFSCLTLRLGYNYGNAVTPPGNVLNAFNMQTIEDHITVGGTFKWGCNELSVNYVHGFRHSAQGKATDAPVLGLDPETLLIDRSRQYSVGVAYARRF